MKEMLMMKYAISMSEVRRRPGEFFDSVIRERPAIVTRHRDMMMAFSESQFKEFVKHLRLTLNVDYEGRVYAIDIPELDLLAWGENLEEAKDDLVEQVIAYAQEYLDRFNLFFNAPNRRPHLPYVFRVLLCDSKEQVKELFS
jgi:hypothetical protein